MASGKDIFCCFSVSLNVIDDEMISDILAPALLIAALFLINFIVLFYIYKIKQK
jgi:hypothetical protein